MPPQIDKWSSSTHLTSLSNTQEVGQRLSPFSVVGTILQAVAERLLASQGGLRSVT